MSDFNNSLMTAPTKRLQVLPWLDYSTTAVPVSHTLILWWAQYLWLSDPNYKTAFQRVGAHFITTVEFPELDSDEESAFKDLFNESLNYRRELQSCADEFLGYGNLFVGIYLPFKRVLICKGCRFEQPIKHVDYKVELHDKGVSWKRTTKCAKCGDTRDFECKDRKDPDISKVKLNRYSPFEIELAYNRFSQRKDLYWKIPQMERDKIRRASPIHIEDTPMAILEAVAINGDVRLEEETTLHIDETMLTGMETHGWGVPRAISNFRLAWLMQTTNRADQAIAMDYTLGMRIFSPGMTAGGTMDPMQAASMDKFVHHVQNMVSKHRQDPATYHTAPYPLNYQFAGGEGQNLLPADKLKFRQQEFLNALGIPLEYHAMTLSAQAAPMALQLFENTWQAIPAMYNQILNWIVKVCARNFDLDETKVTMEKTTIAFDEARKQIMAQLMSANQISPETALQPFGINAVDEVKKVFKHQKLVAKEQEKADEEAQEDQEMAAAKQMNAAPGASALAQQQQAGQQAAQTAGGMGGMPGMGGAGGGQGGSPSTIQGMSDQADQIAGQLVSMPEYDRKQQLKAIRESNKDLHSLVTSKMEKIRQQAASQGQQQMLATPPAGGAPPAK